MNTHSNAAEGVVVPNPLGPALPRLAPAQLRLSLLVPAPHSQVLVGHLVVQFVSVYGCLATLLPLLPPAAKPASHEAAAHAQHIAALPPALMCAWDGQVPLLRGVGDEEDHAVGQAGAGTAAAAGAAVALRRFDDDDELGLPVERAAEGGGSLAEGAGARPQAGGPGSGWVARQAARLWERQGIMQGLEPIHVAPHLLQQQQRQQQQQQQRQQQQQQQTPHTQDTKELSSQDPGTGAGKGAVAELEGRQGALVGAVPQQQAPGKAAKVKAKAKAKLPGPAAVATALPQK